MVAHRVRTTPKIATVVLDTVAKCIELRPDRLSGVRLRAYSLLQEAAVQDRRIRPAPEVVRHFQSELIAEALVDAGYVRISFDHFALPRR